MLEQPTGNISYLGFCYNLSGKKTTPCLADYSFLFVVTSLFGDQNDKVFVLLTMPEINDECNRTTSARIIKPWTLHSLIYC